jgi:mannose-6-phosphate isomerase
VPVQPIPLGPNQPATFYRGSGRLAAFRGMDLEPRAEDWVASTTARFGQALAGLTKLPDGTLLKDTIATDAHAWLGPDHVARFGDTPALLVKLLDTGQRLPIHVHPSREFARSQLDSSFGKTEAWIVLEAAPDAAVRLGFQRDVEAAELARWFAAQDVEALLEATNRVPVAAGDAILCPAGLPHAIGSDILLIELQEPTDFSVLLEWRDFAVDESEATLGLSPNAALACVDRRQCSSDRLASLHGSGSDESLLPEQAAPFFAARRVSAGRLPTGFSVLVGIGGSGALTGEWGSVSIRRGATVVVPYAAHPCNITGDVTAILCLPGG